MVILRRETSATKCENGLRYDRGFGPFISAFPLPYAARFFSQNSHIPTNSWQSTTGSCTGTYTLLCAPRMPTLRPRNAYQSSKKRPFFTEETLFSTGAAMCPQSTEHHPAQLLVGAKPPPSAP
jgi:hypothetical protein